MNLPRFALNRRTLALTVMTLCLLWGLQVYETIPRNEDPSYLIRVGVVTTRWSGATAQEVEELITVPLERAIVAIDEVRAVWSESRIGVSVIYVELEDYIKKPDAAWNKVKERITQESRFIRGDAPPYVDTSDFASPTAMVLALSPLYPQKYSYEELRKFSKVIQTELNPIPYMGKFQFFGVQPEIINLEISAGIWSKLQISTEQLRYALQEKNVVAPGGSLDTKLGKFTAKFTGEFSTTKQIEEVVLGSLERRAPTYLRDLGIRVVRTYPDPPSHFCRYRDPDFSGDKCLMLAFNMKSGGNIVHLGKAVKKKLKLIKKQKLIPEDIKIFVVSDQPKNVENTINTFTSSLFSGIFVVLIVGFLMVGIRMSAIMAISIPIVMIISLGVVRIFGVQLEQVSIASFMVALGMLVDNAIEVSENVHRLMCEGKTRFEAAWQGASEIAIPILTATLTTIAAFLPMLIIPGSEGEYTYSLPVVVSVTLMVSWLVALTVTTIFCYWFIRPTSVQGGLLAFGVRSWVAIIAIISRIRLGQGEVISFTKRLWVWVMGREPIQDAHKKDGIVKSRYARLLRLCLRRRYLTVIIGLVTCFCTFSLVAGIGSQFFPLAYRNQFMIDIWLPQGVPITQTDDACRKIEEIVYKLREVDDDGQKAMRLKHIASFIGSGVPRFYISVDPLPQQPNLSQIIVTTTDPKYVDVYIKKIRERIARQIAGVRVDVRKLNLGTRTGAPIALRIVGKKPKQLRMYGEKVKKYLYQQKDILSIYDDWGYPSHQVKIDIHHELANLAGVTNRNAAQMMSAFLEGQYLTTFREGDHNIPVFLRLPKNERDKLISLYNLHLQGNNQRIPLEGVADINIEQTESLLIRKDQEHTLTVFAYLDEGILPNDLVNKMIPDLDKIKENLAPGYRIEIGGEWEDTRRSEKNFNKAFTISLFFIIMILVAQYNGLAKPFLILLTLPMAFSGSIIGLYITGWPLNFMAQLGMLSLAGIVLNDAIVLIDFVDKQMRTGLSAEDAIVKGSCMRMIPILLTTFTTAGGLLPLALWGGPLWVPMANVVIFGLVTATLLTLLFIPTFYMIMHQDLKIKMVQMPDEVEEAKIAD